jgi:tetratricopeptide (TPR) repeat protein
VGDEQRYAGLERDLRGRIEAAEERRERARWTVELLVLYSRTGRQEEAKRLGVELLTGAEGPDEQAAHLLQLGQLSEQTRDFEAAAAYYREGIVLGAGGQEVRYLLHNNLGYCRNHLGEPAEGEGLCREAIGIDPERHNAYKNLGIALERQGMHCEAADMYWQAAERNAQDPRALRHLLALAERAPDVLEGKPELKRKLDGIAARARSASGLH